MFVSSLWHQLLSHSCVAAGATVQQGSRPWEANFAGIRGWTTVWRVPVKAFIASSHTLTCPQRHETLHRPSLYILRY